MILKAKNKLFIKNITYFKHIFEDKDGVKLLYQNFFPKLFPYRFKVQFFSCSVSRKHDFSFVVVKDYSNTIHLAFLSEKKKPYNFSARIDLMKYSRKLNQTQLEQV